MDIEVQLTLNQSRVDEITMREDYGNVLPLHSEDGFDLGFDATSSDILRHSVGFDQSLQQVRFCRESDSYNFDGGGRLQMFCILLGESVIWREYGFDRENPRQTVYLGYKRCFGTRLHGRGHAKG